MTRPTAQGGGSGLREAYEATSLDMPTLEALAKEVAHVAATRPASVVSNDALPKVTKARVVTKDVRVPGFFGSRVERRTVTESYQEPDRSKAVMGWLLAMRNYSKQERMRKDGFSSDGAYIDECEHDRYALTADGKLVWICESYRELILCGPTYQRVDEELKIKPLKECEWIVLELDHEIHYYHHTEGRFTWSNEATGKRLREGVRGKGDFVRSALLDLVEAGEHTRLAAAYPSTALARRKVALGPRVFGRVKWFDGQKGFGFIAPDVQGPDVFLHVKQLASGASTDLSAGTRVSYVVGTGQKGPVAREVRIAQ